jgi:hypothetical protein
MGATHSHQTSILQVCMDNGVTRNLQLKRHVRPILVHMKDTTYMFYTFSLQRFHGRFHQRSTNGTSVNAGSVESKFLHACRYNHPDVNEFATQVELTLTPSHRIFIGH